MMLLDTCVLSEQRRVRPEPRVQAWLLAHAEVPMYISVLTIGEIERGIARLADAARRVELELWLGQIVGSYADRILPIGLGVSRRWGRISGDLSRRGVAMAPIDGLIAATALEAGAVVVTRNTDDFAASGVMLVNPWTTGPEGSPRV